jgi:hypothetical protein
MTSLLAPHWQITHQGQRDYDWLKRWRPKSIKIITTSDTDCPGIDIAMQCTRLIVVRNHPISENFGNRGFVDELQAVHDGRVHAELINKLWLSLKVKYPNLIPDDLLFEGLNEPREWSDEPPYLTALYYAKFLAELHKYGLNGLAGEFGVGKPDNRGTDTAPCWDKYQAILDAMGPKDYLGLHAYFNPGTLYQPYGNWTAFRSEMCPWKVPIIISEFGCNQQVGTTGVSDRDAGWKTAYGGSLDQNAGKYLADMKYCDNRFGNDSRIHSVQIYDFDFDHPWDNFDIREEVLMKPLLDYIDIVRDNVPPVVQSAGTLEETIIRDAEGWIIPLNKDAAFWKYAQAHNLGERLTAEFDITYDGIQYRYQVYERGIVYAPIGQWDKTSYFARTN